MGTVQLNVETLQLADSVMKVVIPSRIATLYPVIDDPPSEGAIQEIVTLVFEVNEVVGAAGTLGIFAALIFNSDEPAP